MKMTKKIMSLAIVFAMVMAMSVSVFAAGEDGKITISNATAGKDYTIYKVFDATYTDGDKVSYTTSNAALIAKIQKGGSPFTLTGTSISGKYNVASTADATTISTWLTANIALLEKGKTIPATGATVIFDELAYGYYYITSTLGSVVTVDSNLPEVVVIDKNQQIGVDNIDKGVCDTENGTFGQSTTVNFGDDVFYKLTLTDATMFVGTTKVTSYTISDVMPAGIALATDSVKVYVNGTQLTENYSVDATAAGFTATLNWVDTDGEALYKVDGESTIVITYKGVMDAEGDAVNLDGVANTNTATFKYNTTTIGTKTADVYTYTITANKVDGNATTTTLMDAEFKLSTDAAGENLIKFSQDANGNYYYDADGEITTLSTTFSNAYKQIVIKGLEAGTYYLTETKAPAGYNMLTTPTTITTGAKNDAQNLVVVDIDVQNFSGTELPSTGGIGTTIFYALGGLMAVGAGVLLVAKKRMEA